MMYQTAFSIQYWRPARCVYEEAKVWSQVAYPSSCSLKWQSQDLMPLPCPAPRFQSFSSREVSRALELSPFHRWGQ